MLNSKIADKGFHQRRRAQARGAMAGVPDSLSHYNDPNADTTRMVWTRCAWGDRGAHGVDA
eukprot:104361-Chlamydomonas_euryale.AAC.1